MPWAAGSYTKGNSGTGGWTGDASLGIGIEAGRHDTQDNDFATGINQCINKDGSNAFTGNPNLGGFIPTNIAAGTAAAPALCVGGDVNTGVFGPAADTWAVATNGTERVRVLSDGKVGIGTTAPADALEVATTSFFPQYWSGYPGASAGGANLILRRSRGATVGTNTILQNNDVVGAFGFQGANGTTFTQCATIAAVIDGTPGASNDMPGRLEFYTTPDGSGTPTERMRIAANGRVGIGATSPGAVLDVRTPYNDTQDFLVGEDLGGGNWYFRAKLISRHTTGSAANVFIDSSNHILQRSTSSLRYKTDVQDYNKGIESVLSLRPVFYKGINDGDKQFAGLIAEEVHEAGLTEFVSYNDENQPDALHYGNMVALAFKAIQELNAKVEALEAQVAALTPAPVEEPEA